MLYNSFQDTRRRVKKIKADIKITQARIKTLIDRYCEGNQNRFASSCGVSKYSISQYVNGSNAPGNVSAAKIAKAYGLNPLWVMGFDVPMISSDDTDIEHSLLISDDEHRIIGKYRRLTDPGKKRAERHIDNLLALEADEAETEMIAAHEHEGIPSTVEERRAEGRAALDQAHNMSGFSDT